MPILLGILAAAGAGAGATGIAAYFSGGRNSSGASTAISKLTFATETTANISGTLSNARPYTNSMADKGVAGYVKNGGEGSTNNTTTNRISFPDDSVSTIADFDIATSMCAGFANWTVAGYFAGGRTYEGEVNTRKNTIKKYTFPSEAFSTLVTTLSAASQLNAAMSNSGTAGYIALANTASGDVATVDKLTYSGETRSTLGTGLSVAKNGNAGMSDSGTAGYFGGGGDPLVSTVDKFAFPSDTRSTLGTGLSATRWQLAAAANTGIAGYFAGGNQDSGLVATIDKFAFPSDTRSTLGTGLPNVMRNNSGMADG